LLIPRQALCGIKPEKGLSCLYKKNQGMKKLSLGKLILLVLLFATLAEAADLTVARDGSGDVKTVGEAIERVPENNRPYPQ
jgi:hypothetical protein